MVSQLNLDMNKCIGQAYDGASNMSGREKGAASIILEKYPLASYQHCQAHCLNLALMKSCTSLPEMSMCNITLCISKILSIDINVFLIRIFSFQGNIWHYQNDLVSFFSRSPKRQAQLEKTILETSGGRKQKLVKLSQTRWTARLV